MIIVISFIDRNSPRSVLVAEGSAGAGSDVMFEFAQNAVSPSQPQIEQNTSEKEEHDNYRGAGRDRQSGTRPLPWPVKFSYFDHTNGHKRPCFRFDPLI